MDHEILIHDGEARSYMFKSGVIKRYQHDLAQIFTQRRFLYAHWKNVNVMLPLMQSYYYFNSYMYVDNNLPFLKQCCLMKKLMKN